MLFKSAEIRWFSNQKEPLLSFYKAVPPVGKGILESERTDHYLVLNSTNTGIKIREGKHEIKLKSDDDLISKWGTIEKWKKWSYDETADIINSIDDRLLSDWIGINKKRMIKKYDLGTNKKIENIMNERVSEGCGVEFTEISIEGNSAVYYTLGLEAFSKSGNMIENLLTTIDYIKLKPEKLNELVQCSYPAFLYSLFKDFA